MIFSLDFTPAALKVHYVVSKHNSNMNYAAFDSRQNVNEIIHVSNRCLHASESMRTQRWQAVGSMSLNSLHCQYFPSMSERRTKWIVDHVAYAKAMLRLHSCSNRLRFHF